MNILKLNINNFNDTIDQKGIVIVDCWAAWCDACSEFKPVFESAAEKFGQHTFCSIDAMEEKELIKELGIENIPALMIYRDGILLFRQPGYFPADKLEDVIRQTESLDMQMVKDHIRQKNENSTE